MTETIYNTTQAKMSKCIEAMKQEFASIRTGQASASFIQDVPIEIYHQKMPLKNVASIAVHDAKTLLVNVWSADNVTAIDSSIRKAELGLNPRIDGQKIYVPIPDLTAERRQQLVKHLKKKSEDSKITIRNIRREANDHLKSMEKELPEDDYKSALKKIQTLTDQYIQSIETTTTHKQQEIETL